MHSEDLTEGFSFSMLGQHEAHWTNRAHRGVLIKKYFQCRRL